MKEENIPLDWAKTYTTKFFEVGGERKDQCSLEHL
jgi:hypothetical protein